MWADESEPFRPKKRSWSPWGNATALALGVSGGAYLLGSHSAITFGGADERVKQVVPDLETLPSDDRRDELPRAATRGPRRTDPPQDANRPAGGEPAPPPATREVYLCKDYGGGMFWSSASCSTQRATIDRIVTVPGRYSWAEAVEAAERQK